MKQINFIMSFTCTDEQFLLDDKLQNMLSDQWKDDLIQSAKESGFDDVEAQWNFEDLN